jgi:hypothetical protein
MIRKLLSRRGADDGEVEAETALTIVALMS